MIPSPQNTLLNETPVAAPPVIGTILASRFGFRSGVGASCHFDAGNPSSENRFGIFTDRRPFTGDEFSDEFTVALTVTLTGDLAFTGDLVIARRPPRLDDSWLSDGSTEGTFFSEPLLGLLLTRWRVIVDAGGTTTATPPRSCHGRLRHRARREREKGPP